ncbi:hypothetical protein BH23ACT10_BH23ACT10_30650 [soil metagenome]
MSTPTPVVGSSRPRSSNSGVVPDADGLPSPWHDAALGAVASIPGAALFGAGMAVFGTLPTIAQIMRSDVAAVGLAVHLVVSAALGAGLGVLVRRQSGAGGGLVWWSAVYAGAWWLLGALTALPVLVGDALAWQLSDAQAQLPSLFGHLVWGVATGATLTVIRGERPARRTDRRPWGAILRAIVAGAVAALALQMLLGAAGTSLLPDGLVADPLPTWLSTTQRQSLTVALPFGLVALGLGPGSANEPIGPVLIRGCLTGVGWWMTVTLTALPLLVGVRPAWTIQQARAGFVTLPPLVLVAVIAAVVCAVLERVGSALFSDRVATGDEGAGTVGLRALAVGTSAGLAGGAVFAVVLVGVDAMQRVAGLMGSGSMLVGLVVHLAIASAIGVIFALAFRHHAPDVASALGWGLSYGMLWWVLGGLTLLPVLLGEPVAWSVGAAGAQLPSLVGHLLYGMAMAVAIAAIDAGYSPWWIARQRRQQERLTRRLELVRSSAPALWASGAMTAVLIMLILAG